MKKKENPPTLRAYVENVNQQLKSNDQERTGQAYMTAMRRFNKFLKREATFEDFTVKTINEYQAAFQAEGRAMNTISFYMRNTRVIYNRACNDGIVKKKKTNLFDKVYTGTAKTKKRALTKDEMRTLSSLEIKLGEDLKAKQSEKVETGQDKKRYECLLYHLFGFHGRGISFVDLCHLRKSNIHGEEIHYFRKKTSKQMAVKLTEPMQDIINYFSGRVTDSPYLFPILREGDVRSLRAQYENALCLQNRRLKEVARIAGITKPLSTHVARHSWATIARDEGFGIAYVSQALGHSDERTTAIYLASFDESVMDEVSDTVSRSVSVKGKDAQKE